MKTINITLALILHFTLSIIHSGHSQDSLRYSQESGTLQKQRFIDQYDYVFMTKEPTKWMLKVGIQPQFLMSIWGFKQFDFTVRNHTGGALAPLWANFERKISPSISLQLGLSMHSSSFNSSYFIGNGLVGRNFGSVNSRNDNLMPMAEVRWYYDMKKRIDEGKSANNFSGNYFSLKYEKIIASKPSDFATTLTSNGNYIFEYSPNSQGNIDTENYGSQLLGRLSLNYGIQRRFLKHGFIDFGVSLATDFYGQYKQNLLFPTNDRAIKNLTDNKWRNSIVSEWAQTGMGINWFLHTNMTIGLAWGDFKKTERPPLCEVLKCYEDQTSMFKIAWPSLQIGKDIQTLNASFAFEHKLDKSLFSFNYQLNIDGAKQNASAITGFDSYSISMDKLFLASFNINLEVQPRYYFMQKFRRGQPKGNNLSGPYIGLRGSANYSNLYAQFESGQPFGQKINWIEAGVMVGYQQKLFKNGYFDLNISTNRAILKSNTFSAPNTNTKAHLGFGFAF